MGGAIFSLNMRTGTSQFNVHQIITQSSNSVKPHSYSNKGIGIGLGPSHSPVSGSGWTSLGSHGVGSGAQKLPSVGHGLSQGGVYQEGSGLHTS